ERADRRRMGELVKQHADHDHRNPQQRVFHAARSLDVAHHPEGEKEEEAEIEIDRRAEDRAEVNSAHARARLREICIRISNFEFRNSSHPCTSAWSGNEKFKISNEKLKTRNSFFIFHLKFEISASPA